jgi:hypothetical protein
MNLNIEQINNILNDLWNFHLVLFGIALTIFTLLYSFILGKREELRGISEQVKLGVNSPLLSQKESFAIKYITRLKSANKHTALTILITFIFFVFSWISHRLVSDCYLQYKKTAVFLVASLTFIIIIYFIFIFIKIYQYYKAETKI